MDSGYIHKDLGSLRLGRFSLNRVTCQARGCQLCSTVTNNLTQSPGAWLTAWRDQSIPLGLRQGSLSQREHMEVQNHLLTARKQRERWRGLMTCRPLISYQLLKLPPSQEHHTRNQAFKTQALGVHPNSNHSSPAVKADGGYGRGGEWQGVGGRGGGGRQSTITLLE